jgi:disulfide bond formation protein DsbB
MIVGMIVGMIAAMIGETATAVIAGVGEMIVLEIGIMPLIIVWEAVHPLWTWQACSLVVFFPPQTRLVVVLQPSPNNLKSDKLSSRHLRQTSLIPMCVYAGKPSM